MLYPLSMSGILIRQAFRHFILDLQLGEPHLSGVVGVKRVDADIVIRFQPQHFPDLDDPIGREPEAIEKLFRGSGIPSQYFSSTDSSRPVFSTQQ